MSQPVPSNDTIAAIATPPGRGGVGIIRVSGPAVKAIAIAIIGAVPQPRYATLCDFVDEDGITIDSGIALYFPQPHSFTGEDVLELQGHGGPVVLDMLLERTVALGARLARPGEFSERAFLNDKLDLSQAEAIADLIDSASRKAAQGAMRSLSGVFSEQVRHLSAMVIELRMFVEAAIDFPEEEVDFLDDERLATTLAELEAALSQTLAQAGQGALLHEGMTLVITGRPNAGKSSLMNCLSGTDVSIVTSVPGTTRDIVDEFIHLDGIPLKLVDTAGIRDSGDEVEAEGVRRAMREVDRADQVLAVIDVAAHVDSWQRHADELVTELNAAGRATVVLNKIDLLPENSIREVDGVIGVSAKTGAGIDALKAHLKRLAGFDAGVEGNFTARRRHVDALKRASAHLGEARQLLEARRGELVAEELRLSHECLCEITGEFTPDDLLGKIFSTFCIGK
ncbi:MAG TPA: tRNA uridine-5-carboxymethylaminomethyl(34) synthesis GTPase MnmE [Pseudomonadales bacterium]|nr:tRNA uridine-5-carboxymethylaminomethyl(34) synthesis GTPase MnmE [Pseudomonadales bacterium]